MEVNRNLRDECQTILEGNGGKIADEARTILLKEDLRGLQEPLEYISRKWRDPLTPSLVILSCEAVGGRPASGVRQAALAITLMSLGLNLWDDIVDKTMHKGVAPTALARYGEPATLMIGGLALAKTFLVLGETSLNSTERKTVMRIVWDYCKTLAETEALNVRLRKRRDIQAREKLKLIQMKGANLEVSSTIGSALGKGSEEEMNHLGNYGRHLGAILELEKDLKTSLNLTLELQERVKSNALTYTLCWAKSRSKRTEMNLSMLPTKPAMIKETVQSILETGALENVLNLMETHVVGGKNELSALNRNTATQTLMFFLDAQPKIFRGLLAGL